jgi:hypothetical protein
MIRRLVLDESGMTMGLAVIMMVLIGVMGAGLLTFLSRDLQTVIETNQGQQALEAAEAGVEAARRHLATTDAHPSSYDPVSTADNTDWYDDSSPKEMTFEKPNDVRVGIRYLTPATSETQAREPGSAPEVLPAYGSDPCNDANGDGVDDDFNLTTVPPDADACDYPNNRNYFRVTVRGTAGNTLRQIQAIYRTENFDIPIAYYATRDIDFNGNATDVSGVSLFANRYIREFRPANHTGNDLAYGNWAVNPYTGADNPYNRIPRTDSLGNPVTGVGAAALGTTIPTLCPMLGTESGIEYSPTSTNLAQKAGTAGISQRYRFRDYDRDTDYTCNGLSWVSSGRPDFRANTWGNRANQPSGTITFPFATNDTAADNELINELKQKAQDQGLYVRRNPGSSFTIDDNGADTPRYPADSEVTETVMFIEFANPDGSFTDLLGNTVAKGSVLYKANSSDADNLVKGTIVVVNGDLNTNSSADDFQGIMIVRDPNDNDNAVESKVMKFDNGGSLNIEGFINVEGDMSLRGSIEGFLPATLVNGVPGLFKLDLWSWRECYNTTCT